MARVAEDVNLSEDESAMVSLLDLNVAKFDGTYVVIDPKVRTKHRKAARYTGSDFGELLKQVVAKRDDKETYNLDHNCESLPQSLTKADVQDLIASFPIDGSSVPNGADNVVSFPVSEGLTLVSSDGMSTTTLPKRESTEEALVRIDKQIAEDSARVRVEPNTIMDPILDDTGIRVRAPKKEKAKRRDNRYIRAGRFLVENPSMTPAQLSKKADLSYPTAKYTMEAFKAAAFVFAEHKVTVAELRNIANTIEK